jgi:pyruvate formate lyase activating enzyme
VVGFKGWVRTSLIDFPDHIATVLFTGGCNFRCPMCHNAELVLHPDDGDDLDCKVLWRFLDERVGKVTGVVISGGEPTLQPDLRAFVERVRGLGYAVKLDTNGYRPDVLRDLLKTGLIDFVAMDIKAPPVKYPLLTGLDRVDIDRIEESVALLSSSEVIVEYRTTVVPEFIDVNDIEALARWLSARAGVRASYVLQQFRGLNTLDPRLSNVSPLNSDILREMAERAGRSLTNVKLRGV